MEEKEIGINLKVENLRDTIDNLLIEAQLPVCLIDYVLTEILNNVRAQRIEAVQIESKLLEQLSDMKISSENNTEQSFIPKVVDNEKIG